MSKLNPISAERKKERRDKIINDLKAMIVPVIFLALIGAAIAFVMTYQTAEKEAEIIPAYAYAGEGDELVMENNELKFVMNPNTTHFELTVKDSGKVWKSVPDDGGSDPLANTEVKKRLQSDLILTYSRQNGLEVNFDSYSYSIANGIYEIEQGADYIRVNYSLGNVEKEYVIPPVAKQSELDKFFEAMPKDQKDICKQFYKKYDINKLTKKDNKEELLEFYPVLAEEPIYVLRDGVREQQKKEMQKFLEEAGYTYEHFVADKELNQSIKEDDVLLFNTSVIYRLDGGDLIVEVPYDSLMGKEDYPIYRINVLPYFGASTFGDNGFMLVPDGSGALIDFNNGKTSQNVYFQNIYGWDMAQSRKDLVHDPRTAMNVFGVSQDNDSFICIMEDGDSYGGIRADVSGKNSSYNYVSSEYIVQTREKYDVGEIANSDIYVYLQDLPDESLVQRYSFISSGSYVDMAKKYGEYLKKTYGDSFVLNHDNNSTPVAVELVGAVDKVKQIVGVPVSKPLALTTFDEAVDVITTLKNDGVNNLSVKFTGWCNGGVKQKYLNKVKVLSELGGKKDLANLSNAAKDMGVDLYLNGITNYEYNSDLFDGFFSYTDAAKYISKERATQYQYSHVTYTAREGLDPYFLLHADKIDECMDNLRDAAVMYGTGISYEDVGKDLSSDYYTKNFRSREEAKNIQTNKLAEIDKTDTKVMINYGNSYAVPYADFVTNMDLTGSGYTILDSDIPFYELAIHGYVDYAGKSINVCGNTEDAVLNAAEYGAGLAFTFMKETPFTLQKTLYTEYYGSDFDAVWGTMKAIYDRFDAELGHVYNQEMVGHEDITATVSKTVYEDGTTVFVNYGYLDETVDGVNVPARDYLVVR